MKKKIPDDFLFNSTDFMTGTALMTYEQKGKYLTLLMLQHTTGGHLSEEDMISVCGGRDERIFSKFQQDDSGLYFNYRLAQEVAKRQAFITSRRAGADATNGKTKAAFTPPAVGEMIDYAVQNGYREEVARRAFDYYSAANWKDSKGSQVRNWKQKLIAVWFKPEHKIPLSQSQATASTSWMDQHRSSW